MIVYSLRIFLLIIIDSLTHILYFILTKLFSVLIHEKSRQWYIWLIKTLEINSFEKGMHFQSMIVIFTSFFARTKPFSWVQLQEFSYEVCSFRIFPSNVDWDVDLTFFDVLLDISLLFCFEWKLFSQHIKQGTSNSPYVLCWGSNIMSN